MLTAKRWIRHSPDKQPLSPYTGRRISIHDTAEWTDYSTASTSRRGIGLGFILGDGYACIDLDHCLTGGAPTSEAQVVIDHYPDAFIDYSPSGTGLHIWGTAPQAPGTRIRSDGLNIETYSQGRYITVTGRPFQLGGLPPL